MAKLTDFGLSDSAIQRRNSKRRLEYLDSRCIYNKDTKQDQKSDIFSFGVVLWEISSGQPPFYAEGEQYDVGLILDISQGLRETPVPDTPEDYVKVYTSK